MGGIIRALIWCLVLEAIVKTGNAGSTNEEVTFTISIKNEMNGLVSQEVVYHCRSSEKDLGWRRSRRPGSEFSWNYKVPPYGNGAVTHNCHFRSSEGTADVKIKTLSYTSTLCGGHTCKYVARKDGIYFIGYEVYHPDNFFGKFFEMIRPAEELVEPWKTWSPQQREARNRSYGDLT